MTTTAAWRYSSLCQGRRDDAKTNDKAGSIFLAEGLMPHATNWGLNPSLSQLRLANFKRSDIKRARGPVPQTWQCGQIGEQTASIKFDEETIKLNVGRI